MPLVDPNSLTGAEIQRIKRELMDQWAARDDYMDSVRMVRHSKHPVTDGKGRVFSEQDTIRTKAGSDHVRRIVNVLSAQDPQVIKPPGRPDRRGKSAAANRLERSSNALLKQLERESGRRNKTITIDHAAVDGEMVSLVLYKPEHWAHISNRDHRVFPRTDKGNAQYMEEVSELKAAGKLPISWEIIDPRTFYPMYGANNTIQLAVVVTEHKRMEMMEEFDLAWTGRKLIPKTQGTSDKGAIPRGSTQLTQLFTADWVHYEVDGEMVRAVNHNSGMPLIHTYAQVTSSLTPGMIAQSVLDDHVNTEPQLDALYSDAKKAYTLHARPILHETVGDGQALPRGRNPSDPPPVQHYEPETKITHSKGGTLQFVQSPQSELLIGMLQMVGGLVNRSNLPEAFRGIATGANEPAWRTAQHISQAIVAFDQVRVGVELHLAEIIKRVWWIGKHKVGEPMALDSSGVDSYYPLEEDAATESSAYLMFRPADVRDYHVRVKINPLVPGLDVIKANVWTEAYHRLDIPQRLVLEEGYDRQDSEDLIGERTIDDYLKQLPVLNELLREVAQEEGAVGILDIMNTMDAIRAFQEQGAGGGGVPGDQGRISNPGTDMRQAGPEAGSGSGLNSANNGRLPGEPRQAGGPRR
jgi:hypothetical protein